MVDGHFLCEKKANLVIYNNLVLVFSLLICVSGLHAQPSLEGTEKNIAKFSATSAVEVQQDLLSISLRTTSEGSGPAIVQAQLKQSLESALKLAKLAVVEGQMDVRTGEFSLYPRYGKDGKITTWQGSVELVLEGKDFTRITDTAGKISSLSISRVDFDLSREQRLRIESDAQTSAIASFRAKAEQISKSFGFNNYDLIEIAIDSNSQGGHFLRKMTALAASVDQSIPIQAGKSTVSVTASGSVRMR